MLYVLLRPLNNQKQYSPKTSPFLDKVHNVLYATSRRTGTSSVFVILDSVGLHGKAARSLVSPKSSREALRMVITHRSIRQFTAPLGLSRPLVQA
jgi:hypothetical protein